MFSFVEIIPLCDRKTDRQTGPGLLPRSVELALGKTLYSHNNETQGKFRLKFVPVRCACYSQNTA